LISCENIVKKFDDLLVIDNVNLNINDGEFLVILGPSGCGKSTFLSMLAGFEEPSSGKMSIDGKQITRPGKDRGFVFQDYALFPWLTVLGNVMSGLNGETDKREIAMRNIRRVGLEDFANEYPHKLSGGMKQRVAIARVLAYDPEILLMDEPFGALDAQTRKLMQQELKKILKDIRKTIVFVTHSVIEAVFLADRVVVFSKRPSKIVYEEEIHIDGQRNYFNEQFMKYRERILHHLDVETGIVE